MSAIQDGSSSPEAAEMGTERNGQEGDRFKPEELEEIGKIVDQLYDENDNLLPEGTLAEMKPNPLNELVNNHCDYDWAYRIGAKRDEMLRYIDEQKKAPGVTEANPSSEGTPETELKRHNIRIPLQKNYPVEAITSESKIMFVRDDGIKSGLRIELYSLETGAKIKEVPFEEGVNLIEAADIPTITVETGKISPGAKSVDVSIYQENVDVKALNERKTKAALSLAA